MQLTASSGLLEGPVVGMTTDEAQNRWIATSSALYLQKPGAAQLRRYDARDGLHLKDNPVSYCDTWAPRPPHPCLSGAASGLGITSIAGGAAGEVFVGYAGVAGGTYDFDDDNRHSGKLDRVRLSSNDSLQVDRFDLVAGVSVQFWHDRTVLRLLYDHHRHAHELLAGTNHGVVRLLPDRYREPLPGEWFNKVNEEWMGDHLHPRVCFHAACDATEQNQRMGDWRGLALTSTGELWVAGKWTAGRIRWSESPADWFSRPGAIAFAVAFGDPYPQAANADGFVNEPVFRVAQEGDPVSLSAVAVAPDGRAWFSSAPQASGDRAWGVAVWDGRAFRTYDPQRDLGMSEPAVIDLVALPDGRLVLAAPSTGLVLFDPATGSSLPLRGLSWLPDDRVRRLELDTMVDPPALHVATANGAAVLRLLPSR